MYNYNRFLKLIETFYLPKENSLLMIRSFLGKMRFRVVRALFSSHVLRAYYRCLNLDPRRFGRSFTFDIIIQSAIIRLNKIQ